MIFSRLESGGGEKGPDQTVTVLEAGRTERNYWSDLWRYRELFAVLAWRDIAVQYKQSAVGVLWALVRPALIVIVFTVIFGKLAKLPSPGSAPYPVMVMAGMLPWFLMSTVLTRASDSLVTNSNLVSKIYFPRVIVPIASSGVAVVDFLIGLVLALAVGAAYGVFPDHRILLLPIVFAFAMATVLGPALILAALNVRYRDFRFIVPFLVQFGLYVSPVGFSSAAIPDEWRLLFSINPAVAVIDAFRWCLLGEDTPLYLPGLALGFAISTALLWLGIRTFRATERTIADVI